MRKMLSSLSLFALLFVSAASLPAQTGPPVAPASQAFTSQEGHFRIIFAGEPKRDSQVVPLKGGGSTTLFQFTVELDNDNIAYIVMYNDYPGDYANGDPQSVLATTRDGAVSGKTLLTDVPITLNGVPGRAFTATDSSGLNYTVHQYLSGKRLYQLIIVGSASHPAIQADQFLSSFQVW
ncbi:MAG: hypothetical protein P4L11_04905 [Geothrix sp.]|nr:hypothetical protein [Geothrix sp.]